MTVTYRELLGELKPATTERSLTPGVNVVLSSISHGASVSPSWSGMVLRYVGRGAEHYKIGGRYYRVGDDQLMIAPQTFGSEVEIRKGELAETLGLCIFFPELGDGSESLIDGPIVLPSSCALGERLKQALRRLIRQHERLKSLHAWLLRPGRTFAKPSAPLVARWISCRGSSVRHGLRRSDA